MVDPSPIRSRSRSKSLGPKSHKEKIAAEEEKKKAIKAIRQTAREAAREKTISKKRGMTQGEETEPEEETPSSIAQQKGGAKPVTPSGKKDEARPETSLGLRPEFEDAEEDEGDGITVPSPSPHVPSSGSMAPANGLPQRLTQQGPRGRGRPSTTGEHVGKAEAQKLLNEEMKCTKEKKAVTTLKLSVADLDNKIHNISINEKEK